MLGAYEDAELVVRAGLYKQGADPTLDKAVRVWPALDAFFAVRDPGGPAKSFDRLRAVIDETPASKSSGSQRRGE